MFPWLSCLLFLPLLGAVLLAVIPSARTTATRRFALVWGGVCFLLSVVVTVIFAFHAGNSGSSLTFQFNEHVPWVPSLGIGYHVGLDGVGALLLVLNNFLFWVGMIVTPRQGIANTKLLFALMLAAEAATTGVIVSLDLVLFYFFWEGMLIPLYFLLGMWGGPQRGRATLKFVVYTVFGSLLMLVGILYVGLATSSQYHHLSFDLLYLAGHPLAPGASILSWIQISPLGFAFLAFALAFAIKAPLVPFHSWLPDSYEAAPVFILVFFAGIVGKLGLLGFLRFGDVIFSAPMHQFQWLLIGLAVLSILWGGTSRAF